jgi:hypothetical protein
MCIYVCVYCIRASLPIIMLSVNNSVKTLKNIPGALDTCLVREESVKVEVEDTHQVHALQSMKPRLWRWPLPLQ